MIKFKQIIIAVVCMTSFSCGSNDGPKTEKVNERETLKVNKDEPEEKKVILFFGNSLTAGYGVESSEAFPTIIQQKLDSLGYNYEVINAGVSGETTAGGLGRVDWVVEKQPIDIFVLELGANDGLRGINPDETYSNLKAIIEEVRAEHPDVKIILAGMMVPPNMGAEYSNTFKNVFPRVAEEKEVALVPFILEDIGGIDSLNQADKIHPNAQGHKIMAENVWVVLEDYLEK